MDNHTPPRLSAAEDAEHAANEADLELARVEKGLIDAQRIYDTARALCAGGKGVEEATEGTPLYRARAILDELEKQFVDAKTRVKTTHRIHWRLSRS
jgi:hypothetical protein